MRVLTLQEALDVLEKYPKIKAAIEREGASHVRLIEGHVSNPAVRARLAQGRIAPEEDVPATGPTTLAEHELKVAEGRDDTALLVGACYVYLAELSPRAA